MAGGIASYANLIQLQDFLNGNYKVSGTDSDSLQSIDANTIESMKMLSTDTNGIEGIPYQFMETIDRRLIDETGRKTGLGRKYAEKVFAKMPLLFLTPCEPLFMDDFNSQDVSKFLQVFQGSLSAPEALALLSDKDARKQRRYYSSEFKYDDYFRVLNPMLSSIAHYLGIAGKEVSVGGKKYNLGDVHWERELNDSFAQFFSAKENLVFYLDGLNNVSENFTNNTTESSLAGMVNGLSEQVNELRFLFGRNGDLSTSLAGAATEATEAIGSGLSSLSGVMAGLAGGVIGSVTENIPAFMDGAKITFPKIWGDSSFDRSFNLEFKLRSPDHDSLSIFLNVLKPYCKILALTLPREYTKTGDPNVYTAPFLVRAAAKGMFNIDMGMITSLSVSKGAECCWNVDGLPTQIDISITIEDLYSSLHTSELDDVALNPMHDAGRFVQNTAYQDYLANMAGLNVAQMEVGRKASMFAYMSLYSVKDILPNKMNSLNNVITNGIYNIYNHI